MKNCPFCAESIQAEAIKCKHCGQWLKADDASPQIEELSIIAGALNAPGLSPEGISIRRKRRILTVLYILEYVGFFSLIAAGNTAELLFIKEPGAILMTLAMFAIMYFTYSLSNSLGYKLISKIFMTFFSFAWFAGLIIFFILFRETSKQLSLQKTSYGFAK